ncbi:hypothetical protein [Okeania sp. SIO1I7]|uniref:hypothetical protein n=1 Tax=Okeania sp. SIO1I7 TaxID=2607772 RepID=UPI0013F92F26|nr:hypothetical protein [Okeania sp. SIO1I7]NET25360.1 hypothetical protein [Okeania sp. SIO1I7]
MLPGEVCTVEYTEKYPFQVAFLANESKYEEAVVEVYYKHSAPESVSIDPGYVEEVSLPQDEKEFFFLAEGGPVRFDCYE